MRNTIIFTHDPNDFVYPSIKSIKALDAWVYIIKPYSPPRNLEQNALYWVLLWWVEQQTGNESEYLHEMMGKRYLAGRRKRVKVWKVLTYQQLVKSTTKLNKKEFSEYYQKVELFFLENGVPPLPPHDSAEFQSLYETYS